MRTPLAIANAAAAPSQTRVPLGAQRRAFWTSIIFFLGSDYASRLSVAMRFTAQVGQYHIVGQRKDPERCKHWNAWWEYRISTI
ncbi:hypothetical protein PQQ52_11650 [Paraburkholderia sediminicola]|uniref:hypothetical protein n=1 Tax=Paraburkholderia sediminicola TaxID=458836 RepID=UPI0038B6B6F8